MNNQVQIQFKNITQQLDSIQREIDRVEYKQREINDIHKKLLDRKQRLLDDYDQLTQSSGQPVSHELLILYVCPSCCASFSNYPFVCAYDNDDCTKLLQLGK